MFEAPLLSIFGAGAVLFAVLLLFQKTLYGSAMCLLLVLLQVAAMFFVLGAELIGLMQVLVYAGAIMVLVVIVAMTRPTVVERPWARSRASGWLGAATLGILFLELLSLRGPAAERAQPPPAGSLDRAMAELLFGSQALGTEAVGVLILVAALAVVAAPGRPLPREQEPS